MILIDAIKQKFVKISEKKMSSGLKKLKAVGICTVRGFEMPPRGNDFEDFCLKRKLLMEIFEKGREKPSNVSRNERLSKNWDEICSVYC